MPRSLNWKTNFPYFMAGIMLLVCVGVKLLEHYSFGTKDFDTGIYSNVAWNIANGNGFYSSVLDANHLGEHFSPITAIFAPLMKLYPTAYWLMVAQGLAVGLFLFVFVRLCFFLGASAGKNATTIITSALLFLAFMYRPLVSALCFEFHPSTLAMPLIALSILAIHKKQNILLCVLVVVLLTTKESALLAIAGLGLYAWLVCGRRRLALGLFVLAGVMALVIFKIVIPHFRSETWGHYSRLGPFEHLYGKARYLRRLFLPLGLLPLLAWRATLPALVPIALNLSVKLSNQFSLQFHYDDMSCVFLLVAAAHAAFRIERWTRDLNRPYRIGLVVILLLLPLFNNGHFPFWSSPLRSVPRVWPRTALRQLDRELEATMVLLTPEDGVAAQGCFGPRINFRSRYHILADDFDEKQWLRSGDYIFMSPVGFHYYISDYEAYRKRIVENPDMVIIHRSDVLEVYRFQGNSAESSPPGRSMGSPME